MIIQRLFSSKEQKARRKKLNLRMKVNEHINKAKPGDVLEASKILGDTNAKKRVGERFMKFGDNPYSFEHLIKGVSLENQAENIERLKKGGKIALATGGVVAAGIGAKKLADKKKAKKIEKK